MLTAHKESFGSENKHRFSSLFPSNKRIKVMILKKNKDMDFLMIGSVALKTLNVSAVINYTVGDFRNILIGCNTMV